MKGLTERQANGIATIPGKRFPARILVYLKEVYPLQKVALAAMFFTSAWYGIALLRTKGANTIAIPFVPASGIVTVILMFLLLRIMDDLKDVETDPLFFPERPVPRGDVLPSDLKILGAGVVSILFTANGFNNGSTLMFLVVFIYSLFMYKYFFLKRYIASNILLALITHNPVSYLFFLYVLDLYRHHIAVDIVFSDNLLLGLVFLFHSLSWEVARKIRHPEDETSYQTYSMVLGIRSALSVPLVLSGSSIGILFALYWSIFSLPTFIFLTAAFVFMAISFLRFYRRVSSCLGLQAVTETFIFTTQFLLIVEGVMTPWQL